MLRFMKKMTFMACAAVLTSAIALTSCNKNEQNGPVEPAEVVKTEFAISLPTNAVGNNGPHKMPSSTVQIGGRTEFQGIDDLTLIPFVRKDGKIIATDSRLGSNIVLADISAGSGSVGAKGNEKFYSSVAIPLTTASFLVYGKSLASGVSENVGELNAANLTANTPADIEFQLSPIVATVSSATASGAGAQLLAYMNSIIANSNDSTANPKLWKDYTASDHTGMTALFDTLKTMHALSSFEVARVMTDLYKTMGPLTEAADSIGALARSIRTAISNGTYVTMTGSTADTVSLKSGLDGFPENLKIPSGAVRIKYAAGAFAACDSTEYLAANQVPLSLYTYPSALWYYANSHIKTSNASQASNYDGSKYWAQILSGYTGDASVNSLTRSVAVEDTIQYGVGRFDVQVKVTNLTLPDHSGENITFTAIPVSAVLIGNQRNVGFDFTPTSSAVYTIYDHVMTNTVTVSTADFSTANSNSTLVLETPHEGTPATDNVKIAIELTNNSGRDFFGANGQLIPAGGKFYLVAELVAASASTTQKSVFIQDYTTTAKLTISSVRNAYNEIPDLRTPTLELGMSVDLSWKAGSVYEVTIP